LSNAFRSGFETGDFSEWTSTTGTPTVQTTQKNSGTYAMKADPAVSEYVSKTLASSYGSGTLFWRFYIRPLAFPSSDNQPIFRNLSSFGTSGAAVNLDTDGTVDLNNDVAATSAAGAVALSLNTWYRFELRHLLSDTVGELELRIYLGENTTALETLSLGAQDTMPAPSNINSFEVGNRFGAGTLDIYIDDVGVNDSSGGSDNSWLGPVAAAPEPETTNLLPAALLAELQKRRPKVQQWLDIGPLPDGTTWRISSHASNGDAVTGPGDPVVLKWGSTRKAVNLFTGELIPQQLNPQITDAGEANGSGRRKWARLDAKYGRNRLRRTPVTLTWSGAGATYPRFVGILKNYGQTATHEWQLFCSTDDSALNDEAGARVPKVPQSSYFPSTPDDLRLFYVSIIMGPHDSNGITNKGLIPCQQTDATRQKYVVGLGANTVPAVYVNDIVRATSTYTISVETINGLLCTRINFTTPLAEGDVVTADVDGLTSTVGGGGMLLKNGSQLLKWLVWFAFGDFRGGAYPEDSTAPVHVAAYTALDTFLARNGHEPSMFLGGTTQRRASEVHQAWHDSHETRPYWRHDGKLAAGVFDPIPPPDIYGLAYHFEADQDLLGDLETPRDDTNIAREVLVEYAPDASQGGQLTQKHRLIDVTVPEKVVVPLQLTNSGARVVA
jgi:hypothetical protein